VKAKKFQMKSRLKKTQRDYSVAFKLSVVGQMEQGELTYKQAQKLYGIPMIKPSCRGFFFGYFVRCLWR